MRLDHLAQPYSPTGAMAGGGVKKLPLLLRDSLVSPAPISDLRVTRGAGTAAATGADDDAADSGAAVLMCGGR